jgi:hypothetical protein
MAYSLISSDIIELLDLDASRITSTFLGSNMSEPYWAHVHCPVDKVTGKPTGHIVQWIENGNDAFLESIAHCRVVKMTGPRKIKVIRPIKEQLQLTKAMKEIQLGQGRAEKLDICLITAQIDEIATKRGTWVLSKESTQTKAIASEGGEDWIRKYLLMRTDKITLTLISLAEKHSLCGIGAQTLRAASAVETMHNPGDCQKVRIHGRIHHSLPWHLMN